jgi:hypothetical protein
MNQLKRSFNMATTNIAECFPCDYQHEAMSEIIDVESLLTGAQLLLRKSELYDSCDKIMQADRVISAAITQLQSTHHKIDYGIIYELKKTKVDGPSLQ